MPKKKWKIYARQGEGGKDYAHKCYQNGMIAIGWSRAVKKLIRSSRREDIVEAIQDAYPGDSQRSYSQEAGSIWRFLKEVKKGDIVLMPVQKSGHAYYGEIASLRPYISEIVDECPFKTRRRVNWKKGLFQDPKVPGDNTVNEIEKMPTPKPTPERKDYHKPQPDKEFGRKAEKIALW